MATTVGFGVHEELLGRFNRGAPLADNEFGRVLFGNAGRDTKKLLKFRQTMTVYYNQLLDVMRRETRVSQNRLKSALWSRREISLKTKGRIYEALIRTILLYGCETGLCVLRTSDGSKSLMTACGAFFDAAAATASPVHPSVNAAVSVLSLRYSFNAAYAGFGTLPDEPQVKSSERSSAQLHGRPGGNAGGVTEDLVEDHPGGPRAS